MSEQKIATMGLEVSGKLEPKKFRQLQALRVCRSVSKGHFEHIKTEEHTPKVENV